MKLAFLYSGNLRCLNETIENNLNSFKFAEIDCYISTWDKITYTDKINSPDHIFSKRTLSGDVSYNILNKLADFKNIHIEKYRDISFNLNYGIDNPRTRKSIL